MSKTDKALTASVERDLKKARATFFGGLYENLYVQRKRPGKKSVRAVVDGDNVELVSADKDALDAAYAALTCGKGEVSSTQLRELTEDEVVKALDPDERDTAGRLLGDGQTKRDGK